MNRYLTSMLIVSLAMLTGCGKDQSPDAAAATRRANDAKLAAEAKAASDRQNAADRKTAADAKADATLNAAQATKEAQDKAAYDAKQAADAKIAAELKASKNAKDNADAAIDAAGEANMAKADALLTQLQKQIKEDRLDQAQSTLEQLDDMKGSVPASMQDKVNAARNNLIAKQAAAKIPK